MLEWGREVENTAGVDISESDIMVLLWPNGNIVRLKRGTTAGEILAKQGSIDLVGSGENRETETEHISDGHLPLLLSVH